MTAPRVCRSARRTLRVLALTGLAAAAVRRVDRHEDLLLSGVAALGLANVAVWRPTLRGRR